MSNGTDKSSSNSNSGRTPYNRFNLYRGITLSGGTNKSESQQKPGVSFNEYVYSSSADDWEQLQAEYDAQFDESSTEEYYSDSNYYDTPPMSDSEECSSSQLSHGPQSSPTLKVGNFNFFKN